MKNITIIAAIGKNNEIGKENKLLWHIPDDLKFFQEKTLNKNIIMGRKTLESIGKRLKNRKYIVLTRNHLEEENIEVFHSFDTLLSFISNNIEEEYMVIGGESIYKKFIDYADKMYITKVDKEYDADTYFPEIKEEKWNIDELNKNEYEGIKYQQYVYKRKSTRNNS